MSSVWNAPPPSFNEAEHPLRPYYVAPALDDKLFADASLGIPSGSPSSARLPQRYTARIDSMLDLDDTASPREPLLQGFLSSSLLGFASSALVQPFEVGKTLMQIQWIPKQDYLAELPPVELDDEDALDAADLSDEAEAEAFFQDLTGRTTFQPLEVPARPKDAKGYLERSSVYDPQTKPEWVLPLPVTGGVWDMMKAIGRWRGEGWLALWKGQLTAFCIDAIAGTCQPFLLSLLTSAFAPPSSLPSLPLVHSPRPIVPLLIHTASHLLTGLFVSPLDLVRTRLIAQSSQSRHVTYTGPIDGLQKVIAEEGGLSATYLHSNLLIPTILDCSIRPLLHLATPLIIERVFGLSPSDNPTSYTMVQFCVHVASFLVTLPIECIRKRLQIQSRATLTATATKNLKTCVETRPMPYNGMVHATYAIITEETAVLPPHLVENVNGRHRRPSAAQHEAMQATRSMLGGLAQLYRGFGMACSAQVVVMLLSLVSGREGDEVSGWQEM